MDKEYFAFISYKSEDVEWAIWLQHELEHYHLPASFNGRTDIPHELRPVFRDIDELSAGNLPKQIQDALATSRNLIVVCSPQAAASPWVNQEVETFIALGKTDRIFPFIVEGNSPAEFFPPALRNLPKSEERLGGDVSKQGRDAAFVKVVAGMLGLGFNSLWNRYEKEKAEEERLQRERRDNLLRVQSRFIAEKAQALIDSGDSYLARKLLLEVLPKDLNNPDRPLTIEAEAAMRSACQNSSAIFRGHTKQVNSAAFSPDGKYLVSASDDNTIRIWNAITGREINRLEGHTNWIQSAVFSPNGKHIASSSWDKTVRVWDAKTGQEINRRNSIFIINSAAFSPDGSLIVAADDRRLWIWDIQNGPIINRLIGHTDKLFCAAFSPDGTLIVSSSWDNSVRIWDTKTGQEINRFEGTISFVNSATFCPDSKNVVLPSSDDYTLKICDAFTGQETIKLEGHTKAIYSAAFSSDGKHIVSASYDKTIRIWDVSTGQEINKHEGQNKDNLSDRFYSATFSPDGKRIVWADGENIMIRDSITKQETSIIKVHTDTFDSAAFSPDGKRIILATRDKTIRVWDSSTGQEINKLERETDRVRYTAFNPDGIHIIKTPDDNIIRICDDRTGEEIGRLEGHYDWISSAEFSPDGKRIITASRDKTIRIWDVMTGKEINRLIGHTESVYSAAFSPDGRRIVSASNDKTVRIWDFPPLQELIDETRERFKDCPLTAEERKQYYLD